MTNYIPQNMPQIIPYLTVTSAEDALEFYEKAFGFSNNREEQVKDEDGKIQHAHMKFEDVHIMFGPEGAWGSPNRTPKTNGHAPSSGLYIYCKDVDAMYKKAVAAGAETILEPEDMFWGDRMFKVKDPDGHEWSFATNIGPHQ